MFRKNQLVLLAMAFALCTVSSCITKKQQGTETTCSPKNPIIKTLQNQQGILTINESTRKVSVNVHTPGSIDDVAVYLICNVPTQLPANNTKVVVSGKVRASKEVSQLGGHHYYELEIESLKEL